MLFLIPPTSECGGLFGLKTHDSTEKGKNRLIQLQSTKFKLCLVEVLMVGSNPAVDIGRQKWTRPTLPQDPPGESKQGIPKNRHLTEWLCLMQDIWHSLLPPRLITLPQTQRDSWHLLRSVMIFEDLSWNGNEAQLNPPDFLKIGMRVEGRELCSPMPRNACQRCGIVAELYGFASRSFLLGT